MSSQLPSPCFLLSEQALEHNLRLLGDIRDRAGVEIILAFKGFAMWSAFPLVKRYFGGATASSLHEVMLCNEYMDVKSHTYCVAYNPGEIDEIIRRSSHITFNSLGQLELYGQKARNADLSIGLRVNPGYSDVQTALYNPASPHSRLGISPGEMQELPDGVDGIHLHVLCESDSYALEKVLMSLEKNFPQCLKKAKWLNLGGGHLATRDGYDIEHLIRILKSFREKHGLHIIMEPGSAFAWQTGDLRTHILDIVDRGGVKTAIIDASFTCHMPDCLEMPYRPAIREGSADESAFKYKYRLGGVSCLAGDFLEAYSFDKILEIGDEITFKDMMHYTMVKTTTFNGIQHPAIAIERANGKTEVVRQFGYEDYKNRLS